METLRIFDGQLVNATVTTASVATGRSPRNGTGGIYRRLGDMHEVAEVDVRLVAEAIAANVIFEMEYLNDETDEAVDSAWQKVVGVDRTTTVVTTLIHTDAAGTHYRGYCNVPPKAAKWRLRVTTPPPGAETVDISVDIHLRSQGRTN